MVKSNDILINILEFIKKKGTCNQYCIFKHFPHTYRYIVKNLNELIDMDYIIKTKNGREALITLTQKGEEIINKLK